MNAIDPIAAKFYALPYISSFFESHAMLRIASKSYGTPLFLILCALLFLILILLLSKIKPKKGRPKPIKEEKPKKASRVSRRKRKEKKPKGTPKAILRKLEKIPASTLPLYPVADKKREIVPAPDTVPAIDMPVADATAPQIDAFDQIASHQEPAQTDNDIFPGLDAAPQFDDFTTPDTDATEDLGIGIDTDVPDEASTVAAAESHNPNQFGAALTTDDFDINIPSFDGEAASSETDDLSDEAKRKFEELQQRGVTS